MAKVSLEEFMEDSTGVFDPPIEGVVEFLMQNPRPTDDEVTQWAVSKNLDPKHVHEYVYKVVVGMAKRMSKSLAIPDKEFNSDQLNKGIKVELEHTDVPEIAKAIAKDHLLECPTYYTRLEVLENRCAGVSTEAMVDGKRRREMEYTFYGKMADMSQLGRAIHKEEHEQWALDIDTDHEIKVRIRAVNDMRWILTTKVKYAGQIGCEETECDISKDMFEQLKLVSKGGVKKTRYVFKIEGQQKVWELDVFKDNNGQNHPWVKLDLEVKDPADRDFPKLPVSFVKGDFISRQSNDLNDEEKRKIKSLWGSEWAMLDDRKPKKDDDDDD